MARCCQEKGHEDCQTCAFAPTCSRLRQCGDAPQARLQRQAETQAQRAHLVRTAPFFARWLSVLFWLVIPITVVDVMRSDLFIDVWPDLYMPCQVLMIAVQAVYCAVLLVLSRQNELYRLAGICQLLALAVSGTLILLYHSAPPVWTLLLSIPAAAVSLYGAYREFTAHADAAQMLDAHLAARWLQVRKWYLLAFCALYASLLVVFLAPLLALLLALAGIIGLVVVSVWKLICLYRTARAFREVAADAARQAALPEG